MIFARIVSAVSLAVALGSSGTAPQDPAPAVQDLRVALRAGEPLFGELRFDTRLALEVDPKSKSKKLEFQHETRLDYVDELIVSDKPAAGDFDVRRTYLRWDQDLTQGHEQPTASDNSFVGARALITRRGTQLALELIDRLAPQTELEQLLRHSGSAMWPDLPSSAAAGNAFTVDLAGFVRLVVGDEFTATVPSCSLTLRSVDADGVANVDGPLTAMVEEKESHGTFAGTCTLAIDTKAHSVRTAEWKGSALLVMNTQTLQSKLAGSFEAQLAVHIGDDARKALDRHIVYRAVRRTLQQGTVAVELPSHWYSVEGEDKTVETFRTTIHGANSPVTLELSFFDTGTEDFTSIVDVAVAKLGKEYKLSSTKSATSPLGKGRSMRFETKENGVPYDFLLEFHPCGKNRMMRARLFGPEKAFDPEVRDWPATLRTFELTSAR
jgi:hypothetical protein